VDVITKPGMGSWRAGTSVAFRDESLNARPPLADEKAPEQLRRFGWTMDGPLVRNRTSFSLSLDGSSAFEAKTIRAAGPDGLITGTSRQPADRVNVSARVEHALSASHTLRAEVSRESRDQDALGVGDFDLPERAYAVEQSDTILRLSDTGSVGRKMVNELRVQVRWQGLESTPASPAPAVRVLDAFTSGGAQVRGGRTSREIEFGDNVDLGLGRHALRAGILLEAGSYESDEERNANGVFTFASLDAYEQGRPTTFQQRVGQPLVRFTHGQFGWYLQDEFRVRKNLQVNLGLRHELQTHLGDWLNLAPRAGVTWSPFKSGSTTVRANAGIFYDWYGSSTYEQTLRLDGSQQREVIVQNPGFPDPFDAGQEATIAPTRLVTAPNLRMPVVRRATVGLDQQVGTLRLMAQGWVQAGRGQLRSVNVNAPVDGMRPDPFAGNVLELQSEGRTQSRGVRLGANLMQPSRRLFASAFYVFSQDRNEADDAFSLPADSTAPGADWGPARTDVTHRFFTFLSARLPRGLRAGTALRAQSGLPYTITTGRDDNGDAVSNDRPAGVGRNTARGAPQVVVDARLGWGRGFGQRTTPPAGPMARIVRVGEGSDVLGGLGGDGDGTSRWRFEVYVQAFNVLNRTNGVGYAGVLTSPFFGQATAALPARRIETGIRFDF
jgi:hypothetical protein